MHEEILTKEQEHLKPLLAHFSDRFGLVGGTALALQLGHRRSIDFDLFSLAPFDSMSLREEIVGYFPIEQELVDRPGELTFLSKKVKMTFYTYRFPITFSVPWEEVISMPDLLTLAAMKAHALGGRSKWKDYVDLYFLLYRQGLMISHIAEKAQQLFGGEFNMKNFYINIGYFHFMDYREQVEFMPGFETPSREIKEKLREYSLQ